MHNKGLGPWGNLKDVEGREGTKQDGLPIWTRRRKVWKQASQQNNWGQLRQADGEDYAL